MFPCSVMTDACVLHIYILPHGIGFSLGSIHFQLTFYSIFYSLFNFYSLILITDCTRNKQSMIVIKWPCYYNQVTNEWALHYFLPKALASMLMHYLIFIGTYIEWTARKLLQIYEYVLTSQSLYIYK